MLNQHYYIYETHKFWCRQKFKINKRTNNKWKLEISQFTTDSSVEIVVGKTRCGKTHFLQKVRLNKFFGKLVKIEWLAGIETDEQREAEIQSCFFKVEFHLATEHDELASLIEKFKLRTRDITNNKNNCLWRRNFNGSCFYYG